MKIYKTSGEFAADKETLDLTKQLTSRIKNQLKKGCFLIVLEVGERLFELYEAYPHLESIRPENSSSVDNYINQVYVADDGAETSVYLPVDAPPDDGKYEVFDEYIAKYKNLDPKIWSDNLE